MPVDIIRHTLLELTIHNLCKGGSEHTESLVFNEKQRAKQGGKECLTT